MSPLGALLRTWKLQHKHRKLNTSRQLVATFRVSSEKPQVVSVRPVELFYRPRTLWIAVQIIGFAALAFWTVKNYMAVFKGVI